MKLNLEARITEHAVTMHTTNWEIRLCRGCHKIHFYKYGTKVKHVEGCGSQVHCGCHCGDKEIGVFEIGKTYLDDDELGRRYSEEAQG